VTSVPIDRLKPILRVALLGSALLLGTGATHNWTATVALTDGGHRLGNPDAKVKLVTYESYTCSHCAEFEKQASGILKLAYVQPGKVSIEVRHVIRDPIDLTAAMLTNCGAPAKFFGNHSAFLLAQPKWIGMATTATKAQRDRWYNGDTAARRRAIASDFGFYKIMETRGYSRVQADICLNDAALAKKLTDTDAADGVSGTPSFAINGLRLIGTYEWALLRPQIDARL